MMLRKIILSCFLVLSSIAVSASKITIKITNPLEAIPILYLPNGNEYPIKINSQGEGEISFKLSKAGYIKIGYNYFTRLFWLDPISTLQLTFNGNSYFKEINVEGDHKAINQYLNYHQFVYTNVNDTELNEVAFLHKSDSLLKANQDFLNKTSLPSSFKAEESKRLVYFTYQTLPSYCDFHKRITKNHSFQVSEVYWNKLKELTIFQHELLGMEDYHSFLVKAARELSAHEFPNLKGINQLTAYVDKQVIDDKVAEFLIYQRVYAYVQHKGLDAPNYMAAFNRYVKSQQLIQNFNQLCEQFNSLNKGSFSVDFNATDINGKKVSLKDLCGKYVYIDIWATWCVPCRKELPYLEKLEDKYKDTDIYFVSISCDTNRKSWERMVTSKTMKGIQLHFSDDSFMKKYLIKGVPHFVLLDKEGRIVSANMSRPSNPATSALFEKLLK